METDIKYYMNNPCTIIRKISDDLSEIQVNIYFAEDAEANNFCIACMAVSNDGSHPTHTCDDADDILDWVKDEKHSVCCIVENRHLLDKPIEHKSIKQLMDKIAEQKLSLSELKILHEEWRHSVIQKKEESEILKKKIASYQDVSSSLSEEVKQKESNIDDLLEKSGSLMIQIEGSSGKSIALESLRKIIEDSVILNALKSGGVDNWEWYEESLENADIDNIYNEYRCIINP